MIFEEWINATFGIKLPDDYIAFWEKRDFENYIGLSYSYGNDHDHNIGTSDIHYFYIPSDHGENNIKVNYYNFLNENIIDRNQLPIAEDSGGDLICMIMDKKQSYNVIFCPYDDYQKCYYKISDNFSQFLSGLKHTEFHNNEILTIKEGEKETSFEKEQIQGTVVDDKLSKYFSERKDGAYINNPNREMFILKKSEFNLCEFDYFVKEHNFRIPPEYVDFLRKYNGAEPDKTIRFTAKSTSLKGAQITVTIPVLLPFNECKEKYFFLCTIDSKMRDYLPVALTTAVYDLLPLLKVKGKGAGKIYFYERSNQLYVEAYDNVNDFFKLLLI